MIFWLGLSNFWIGAWLPFNVFQFNQSPPNPLEINFLSKSCTCSALSNQSQVSVTPLFLVSKWLCHAFKAHQAHHQDILQNIPYNPSMHICTTFQSISSFCDATPKFLGSRWQINMPLKPTKPTTQIFCKMCPRHPPCTFVPLSSKSQVSVTLLHFFWFLGGRSIYL